MKILIEQCIRKGGESKFILVEAYFVHSIVRYRVAKMCTLYCISIRCTLFNIFVIFCLSFLACYRLGFFSMN